MFDKQILPKTIAGLLDKGGLIKALFTTGPLGISIINRNFEFVLANPRLCEILGYSEDELMKMTIGELVIPDDRQLVTAAIEKGFAENLENFQIERKVCRKDGEMIWVQVTTSTLFDEEDGDEYRLGIIEDITERKEKELLIAESEERYSAIFTSSAEAFISIDDKGVIETANPAAEQMFGYSKSELIGANISILVNDTEREQHQEFVENSEIHAPRIINFGRELLGRHKDGSTIPLELNVSPMNIAGKKKFFGIMRNISERKIAEQELKNSEERFKDYASASADRFWESDTSHRLTFVSETTTSSLASPSDDLVGKTRWEISGKDLNQDIWPAHIEDMNAHRPFSVEYKHRLENEKIIHVRSTGIPIFNLAGDFTGYRGTSVNITADVEAKKLAQESGQRLADALEIAPLGITLWDENEKLLNCNDHFKNCLPANVVKLYEPGITFKDLINQIVEINPDHLEGVEKNEFIKMRLSEFQMGFAEREIHIDGKWLQYRLQRLPDNNTIIFLNDITESKHRQDFLRQSQKMESIGQLTGGIAHDFNNILAILLGNLHLAADSLNDKEKLSRRLSRSIEAVNRGSSLTHRLLAFSRKQPLNPRSVDIYKTIDELTELTRRTLGEDIKIRTEVERDVWSIHVDLNQLENVFLNLAINARDAMPYGGTLVFGCQNIILSKGSPSEIFGLDPGDYVKISISDTGEGMSEETLEHAFEPFFTTKDIGKGSGLGLSMVFGFAKQSGGHAEIYSRPGEGTTVFLYLPRSVKNGDQRPEADKPDNTRMGNNEKILIIEDDIELRETISSQLTELGYHVIDGGDGSISIEILKTIGKIDYLLTDVILPGGQRGTEIAAEALAYDGEIKIIIMTGYADTEVLHNQNLDANTPVLFKPFDMQELAATFRTAPTQNRQKQ